MILPKMIASGTPIATNAPLSLPPPPLTKVKMKLVNNSMMKRMKTKNSITMKMKNGVTVLMISVCVISPEMSVRGTGATANATLSALSPPLTMVKTKYKYGTPLSLNINNLLMTTLLHSLTREEVNLLSSDYQLREKDASSEDNFKIKI